MWLVIVVAGAWAFGSRRWVVPPYIHVVYTAVPRLRCDYTLRLRCPRLICLFIYGVRCRCDVTLRYTVTHVVVTFCYVGPFTVTPLVTLLLLVPFTPLFVPTVVVTVIIIVAIILMIRWYWYYCWPIIDDDDIIQLYWWLTDEILMKSWLIMTQWWWWVRFDNIWRQNDCR